MDMLLMQLYGLSTIALTLPGYNSLLYAVFLGPEGARGSAEGYAYYL